MKVMRTLQWQQCLFYKSCLSSDCPWTVKAGVDGEGWGVVQGRPICGKTDSRGRLNLRTLQLVMPSGVLFTELLNPSFYF